MRVPSSPAAQIRAFALAAILASSFAFGPAAPARAEDPPVKPEFSVKTDPKTGLEQLVVKRGETETVAGTFKTLKAGEIFYHWTDEESYARWMSPQGLNQDEFDALRKNFEGEAAGGGFYASRDPFNSSGYGTKCVELRAPRDMRYFEGQQFLEDAEIALLFPDQAKVKRTVAQAVSEVLERFGTEIWEYSSQGTGEAWLNFMKRDTLGALLPVNPADQLASFVKDGTPELIAWASFDLKASLPKIAEMKKADPDIYAYYLEGKRDRAVMDRLRERLRAWIETPFDSRNPGRLNQQFAFQLFPFANSFSADAAHASPRAHTFLNSIRRDFHDTIKTSVLKVVAEQAKTPQTGFGAGGTVMNGLFMGVMPAELGLPPEGFQMAAMPLITARNPPQPPAPNEFGRKFQQALNFLSMEDVVPAMANGNTSPWTLYDEPGRAPFLERWTKASQEYQTENQRMQAAVQSLQGFSQTGAHTPPDPKVLEIAMKRPPKMKLALAIRANRAITEDPKANLRDSPAVGEGNVVVGEKRYYRIEAWKKDRLLAHPFLVAEVIPDPAHPGQFLARHEYPSARTYRKFRELLSPRLQKELDEAEAAGKLANVSTHEFKRLTQAIVAELLVGGKQGTQYGFYWRAVAVYPFGKDTDRVIAVMNSAENFVPIPLRSWREPVFFKESEFDLLMQNQAWKLYSMNSVAYTQATIDNPVMPDFYGHSPLIDFYFDHGEISAPNDAWRIEKNAYLRSFEGRTRAAESVILPAKTPKECGDLFRTAASK